MTILSERAFAPDFTVQIVMGDITEERTDAIVNAANERLRHGGGVAGAISRKGGPSIQAESDAIGFVPTGNAVVTGAGLLSASCIIHAVGPVWHGGAHGEDELLASAVRESLLRASERGLRSVAIPAVSSGIFGFPKDRCASVMLKTLRMFIDEPSRTVQLVRCVNVDALTSELFRQALETI
jgi:O-acetyl-ADP-ribose deacetylase (regulator of RNase III)